MKLLPLWMRRFVGLAVLARARVPVVWVHIHKSGGTTMCSLARKQGEKCMEPSNNCNAVVFQDGPEGRAKGIPCEKRAGIARKSEASWMQIEHEIEDFDVACSDELLYGIMIRDPIELMTSGANHHSSYMDLVKIAKKIEIERTPAEKEKFVFADRQRLSQNLSCTSGCFIDWRFFDNYAVRMLNGKEGLFLPPRGVTRRHLDKAKRLVSEAFDAVLVLDHFDRDVVQLVEVFGWKTAEIHTSWKKNARSHSDDLADMMHHVTPAEAKRYYDALLRINALDLELYNHANHTAAARSRSLL